MDVACLCLMLRTNACDALQGRAAGARWMYLTLASRSTWCSLSTSIEISFSWLIHGEGGDGGGGGGGGERKRGSFDV